MKIAIVLWNLDINGGTQRQALNVALELQKKGNLVDIFCYSYDTENCYPLVSSSLTIYTITDIKPKTISIKTYKRKALQDIKSFVKTIIFFVLSLFTIQPPHNKKITSLLLLIEKENLSKKYDVINLHDYEVYKMAHKLKHQNIVWTMNDAPNTHPDNVPKNIFVYIYNLMNVFIVKRQLHPIHKICVLDKRNVKICSRLYKRNSILIRSGIDINMSIGYNTDYSNKINTSIFLSSIFFRKRRTEDAVEAIKILVENKNYRNVHLHINGNPSKDYNYYTSINKLISKNKLEPYITVSTGMTEKNLIKAYSDAAIFLFPNHNQTWGLAVFEAMLFGCICIVSKTSGAHEVLAHKNNSLLVNPKSPKEIAESIMWTFDNPIQANEISISAKRFVQNNISWKKYAENMLKIYKYS